MSGNGRTVTFPVPKHIAKSRKDACARIFRSFPCVLVIGLDMDADPPRYELQAPGFAPERRQELAELLMQIAVGMTEDEQQAEQKAREAAQKTRYFTPGAIADLVAKAAYKTGDKVKVCVWSDHKELRGQEGEVLMISDGQHNLDSVTYDVLMGSDVRQLLEVEVIGV